MSRRFRPRPARRRQPGRSRWRFIALVVAVALAAFYLTLNAPWSDQTLTDEPQRLAETQDSPPTRANFSCKVAYINDGDTLRCADGTRIRLHAVSARERDGSCSTGHPCPAAAAEAATAD